MHNTNLFCKFFFFVFAKGESAYGTALCFSAPFFFSCRSCISWLNFLLCSLLFALLFLFVIIRVHSWLNIFAPILLNQTVLICVYIFYLLFFYGQIKSIIICVNPAKSADHFFLLPSVFLTTHNSQLATLSIIRVIRVLFPSSLF